MNAAARKRRLVDCNPRWGVNSGEYVHCYVTFDCPEGHADCRHAIPFTPSPDGAPQISPQANGAIWQRTGDTFETLTLTPSIRRTPTYESREAAIAAGVLEEHLTPSMFCALHIFIRDGQIEFCGDSR